MENNIIEKLTYTSMIGQGKEKRETFPVLSNSMYPLGVTVSTEFGDMFESFEMYHRNSLQN